MMPGPDDNLCDNCLKNKLSVFYRQEWGEWLCDSCNSQGKCDLCNVRNATVHFCSLCSKWLCEKCRRNWGARAKGFVKEKILGKRVGCSTCQHNRRGFRRR